MDAELKAHLEDMRTGMMRQIGEHFEVVEKRMLSHMEKLETRLGKRIDGVEVSVTTLGKQMTGVESRLGARIDGLRLDVRSLERRVDALQDRSTSP